MIDGQIDQYEVVEVVFFCVQSKLIQDISFNFNSQSVIVGGNDLSTFKLKNPKFWKDMKKIKPGNIEHKQGGLNKNFAETLPKCCLKMLFSFFKNRCFLNSST